MSRFGQTTHRDYAILYLTEYIVRMYTVTSLGDSKPSSERPEDPIQVRKALQWDVFLAESEVAKCRVAG